MTTDTVEIDTGSGTVSLARQGTGPDVVLLHSLLSDRDVFERIVPALIGNWRVNAVDLPGFGTSTPVSPTIDDYADAVGSLLEAGDYDPATTAVIGNGLGAFIGLGTAIRHGHRFHRLVLAGCGAAFPEAAKQGFVTMIERVETGGMAAVVDIAVRRIFSEEYLAGHPDEFERRRSVLLRTDPGVFVGACRALIDLDYRGRLAAVANPTLVVVGSEDAATPPALAEDLVGGLPDVTYRELSGVAHAPQLQDPIGFLAIVLPFLTGKPLPD